VICFRHFGPAGGGSLELGQRAMARPAPTEKSQLDNLSCWLKTAILELERHLAEQRKITRRCEVASLGFASTAKSRIR
jgi:hypothetical protein